MEHDHDGMLRRGKAVEHMLTVRQTLLTARTRRLTASDLRDDVRLSVLSASTRATRADGFPTTNDPVKKVEAVPVVPYEVVE